MAQSFSVKAVLQAIDENFTSTTNKAMQTMNKLGATSDSVSNKVAKGGNTTTSTFKSVAGAIGVMSLGTAALGAISNGISDVYKGLSETSATWQTFNGNMAYIGKSSGEISKVRGELTKFAQQTIYSASDMASTYSQLAAVGTKNTTKLVKGFGGLASASENPQQAMKTLSEQATQMAAKPMVQWQDFSLMLEQTPAGIAAVAKTMGMSTSELIKNVQDGKVKTEDFFNAIAKTGTNANFSKMATQYKTVGQAMDGLKETLANKLQPAFDKVGKIGIKAVEGITDRLGNINGEKLGDNLVNIIQSVKSKFDNLKNNFMNGFASSFNIDGFRNMITAVGSAINNVKNAFSGVGGSLANSLGSLSGKVLNGISSIITNIADAIGKMSPGQIRAVGTAIASLAGALTLLKGAGSVAGIISNIASGLSAIKGGLGTAFSGIKELPKAFSSIGRAKNDIAGFFSILKDGAKAGSATYFADMLGGSKFGAGIGDMLAKVNGIKTAFASLAPAISGSFLPI